jgi:hypothetical protein
LRRFLPSRRFLSVTGAAVVGVAAALALAAPASAHNVGVTGTAACNKQTGEWDVTWTITNDWSTDAKITDFDTNHSVKDSDGKQIKEGSIVPHKVGETDGKLVGFQHLPGDSTTAHLEVKVVWAEGTKDEFKDESTDRFNLEGTCTKTSTPSASATPTPTPGLPVTGAQAGLYAGIAVVLVGLGAGLFMVARRRRTEFTA